jgi:hypothetical protein
VWVAVPADSSAGGEDSADDGGATAPNPEGEDQLRVVGFVKFARAECYHDATPSEVQVMSDLLPRSRRLRSVRHVALEDFVEPVACVTSAAGWLQAPLSTSTPAKRRGHFDALPAKLALLCRQAVPCNTQLSMEELFPRLLVGEVRSSGAAGVVCRHGRHPKHLGLPAAP